MNLLPENPKKRKLVLITGGVVAGLFAFGFFYTTYFTSSAPSESGVVSVQTNTKIKSVSEDMIKNLEANVADIQGELDQKFYKNLKRYSWQKNSTSPGNSNPFFPASNK